MFGQLCRLKCSYLAKNVLVNILPRFMNFDKQSRGFIPDTYRLLQKDVLVQCLDLYLTSGQFPAKFARKTTLKYHLFHKWRSKAMDSMAARQSQIAASNVIANTGCSPVWDLVEITRKLFCVCGILLRSVCVLLSKRFSQKCPKCQLLVDNRVEHMVYQCFKNLTIRKSVWNLVIDIGGIDLFTKLMHMSQLEQCGSL